MLEGLNWGPKERSSQDQHVGSNSHVNVTSTTSENNIIGYKERGLANLWNSKSRDMWIYKRGLR